MRLRLLDFLRCPDCHHTLSLSPAAGQSDPVTSGELRCDSCARTYPIVRGIPRFVPADNYARSFGYQWTRFYRTQSDDYIGYPLSQERFTNETGWPAAMPNDVILEAGSGMGRFTRCAAATGAEIVTFDYSSAIDVNAENNAGLERVHFVQADIGRLPFAPGVFDRVFCFGVLQHTPSPADSFASILQAVKPGGSLVADVYRRTWKTIAWGQYYLRPFTRRVPPERLFPLVERYFGVVHRLTGWLRPLSDHGSKMVSLMLGTADYRGLYPISEERMREWCLLDTFDKLSPAHDHPQTIAQVTRWLRAATPAVNAYEVRPGYNGLEIHVTR